METAILCAPVFDDVTEYSHPMSREAKEWLEAQGYEVIDLGGRRVRRGEVEEALRENPGALYVFYNHGSYQALFGSPEEAVTDLFNVDLLSGRPVYTMACQSAKTLGSEAWRRNCEGYWGYDEAFNFTTDSLEEFKQFANCGLGFWLETGSWSEALSRAKDLGRQLVDALIKAGKLIASSCMDWDVNHLHCWNGEEPPKPCPVRLTAARIIGPIAWKIPRVIGYGIILFLAGWGIALGKLTHTQWKIGGLREILSLHGDYVGYAMMIIGFLLLTWQEIKWIRASLQKP